MKTRKQKTERLKELLTKGPSLSLSVFGVAGKPKLTVQQEEEIHDKIMMWLSTWVEPLCSDLIKEWSAE